MGLVWLERGEVAKLDRLLDHYRGPAVTDVTVLGGEVSIRVQHRRGGQVLADENLTTWGSRPDHTMLTFGEMLAALKHASRK